MSRKPLALADGEEISRALAMGLDNKDIAVSLGRDESVISREIIRHGGREGYRAHRADAEAGRSRSHPSSVHILVLPGHAPASSYCGDAERTEDPCGAAEVPRLATMETWVTDAGGGPVFMMVAAPPNRSSTVGIATSRLFTAT